MCVILTNDQARKWENEKMGLSGHNNMLALTGLEHWCDHICGQCIIITRDIIINTRTDVHRSKHVPITTGSLGLVENF